MAKSTVFKDFFTNVAVAWFAGGVITPFINRSVQDAYMITSVSVIMTVGFIFLAKKAEKEKQ